MLKEKLMEDLKNSMKEKNVIRKNVIQMVRAAILQTEKDKGIEVDDNKILEIIAKEVKTRNDSLEDFQKGGREDLVEQAKQEIAILSEYLPKQLTKEELTEKIMNIINEIGATSIKDMGAVMKEAKAQIGTATDGKSINEVVRELLQ
jgi:uncharacterized protein